MNTSLRLQVKNHQDQKVKPKEKKKKGQKKKVTDMLIKIDLKNEFLLNIKWKNPEFGLPTVYKEKIIRKNYVTQTITSFRFCWEDW